MMSNSERRNSGVYIFSKNHPTHFRKMIFSKKTFSNIKFKKKLEFSIMEQFYNL